MTKQSSNTFHSLIVWEKWVDPFLDTQQEEPEYIEEEEVNFEQTEQKIIQPVIPFISMGEIFNFWVGHTNFDITESIAKILEQTEGVESLDIITRYRFRIGIGKIFTDRDVMSNINGNVYSYLNNDLLNN